MADPIEVITATQLVSYPGAGGPSHDDAEVWATLANGLVTEAWKNPESPIPFWVTVIALEAAARAARNPKGLQSWTRSIPDGASRTERLSEKVAAKVGVYLTDDEAARLRGDRRRRNRRRFGTIRIQPGT